MRPVRYLAALLFAASLAGCGGSSEEVPPIAQAKKDYDSCLAAHVQNPLACDHQRILWQKALAETPEALPGLVSAGGVHSQPVAP